MPCSGTNTRVWSIDRRRALAMFVRACVRECAYRAGPWLDMRAAEISPRSIASLRW